MEPPNENTEDIVLLAAPEESGGVIVKTLADADIRCIHTINAESCLAQVKKYNSGTVLVDFDLLQDDRDQIITGVARLAAEKNYLILLLVNINELDVIKPYLDTTIFDVIFKPIRFDELIVRVELIIERSYKGVREKLDNSRREMALSARKVCHELNQPLQYIMGAIQLALLDISSEDPAYEMMNGLKQQSERMAQITIDLMHLIRSI